MEGVARLISRAIRLSDSRFTSHHSRRLLFSAAASAPRSSPLKSAPLPPPNFSPWNHFQGQRRTMFVQTQSTPNPASLMFYPGQPVLETGSADFPNARSAMNSSLAKALFGVDGITRVFLWIRFCYCYKVGRCFLGSFET